MPKEEDKYKISEQSARAQLNEFITYYEIDLEDVKKTEAAEGLERTIDKLVKFIRLGRLEIKQGKDGLEVTQHLKKAPGEMKSINYGELSGKNKVAMKDRAEKDFYGKIYSMVGSITGLGDRAIEALTGPDMSLVECIGVLYLNV